MGATYPRELHEIRSIVGEIPLLVPGIGAQGGDVERAVSNGKNAKGTGMIINSSRGIIYASDGKDFAMAARDAAIRALCERSGAELLQRIGNVGLLFKKKRKDSRFAAL